jgi:peptide/nickel transport system substrate-binding protein
MAAAAHRCESSLFRAGLTVAICALMSMTMAGCGGGTPSPNPASGTDSGAQSATNDKPSLTEGGPPLTEKPAHDQPAKPEVLVEAFTPPPLAELDAKAEWIDQPVGDSMVLWREELAKTKPLASVEEALALKNTSNENNAKIVSAMERQPASESEVDYEATFNGHFARDINSTNPLMMSMTEEFVVASLTGYSLFGSDLKMQTMASKDTVVSWQTSKDRLLDKVVIRGDCVWSDGKPITAHDVAFTYQVIMNPKVPIPAMRSGVDKLRWVHAYDDQTVVFFHKEALATNPANMNFPVIPKHVYEATVAADPSMSTSPEHVKLQDEPVCGGAYQLTKRVRGREFVFTRRDDWYMVNGKQVRDKPYIKEFRQKVISDPNTALLAVKKGDIDEMLLTPEMWMTQTTDDDFDRVATKVFAPEWVYFFFVWNQKTPFFGDIRVRKAMSLAFDYKEMLEKQYYGLYQPCGGPFPPGTWWAPDPYPAPYIQDVDKAETLLDEAGWTDSDGDGIRDKMIDGKTVKFEFTMIVTQIPDRVQLAALMRESLDRIGVVCNVKSLEGAVQVKNLQDRTFEAGFGGWGAGTEPDFTENIFGTNADRNAGYFTNPEIDKLYVEGRKEFDRAKRGQIYGKIHNLVYEAQPYTFLYRRSGFYAFNKSVRGYRLDPRGPMIGTPGLTSIYKVKAR